eukprot:scaffold1700_cov129-Skeletonema_dohrnii-CCMP3373.AAC.9
MPIASQLNSPIREPPPLHISRHRSDTFIENNAIDRFRQITNAESNNKAAEDSTNGDDHSYDHRDINPYRRKVGEIVHDERFDVFILILIAINSALYGVATFQSIKQNPDLISDFEKVDLAILIVFTIESSMNIFYEGKRFVRDGWLMFDLIIVIISWAATEVKSLQCRPGHCGDYCPAAFDIDEWSGIAYEVGEQDYWAWLIFIIFVVMSAFVVVNLIIAVICDALQILRKAERAMLFGLSEDDAGEWEAKDNNNNEQVQTEEGRIQQRINDMHRMLDEVVASQEKMHRTIQYLSIVVNSQETKNLSSGSKVMQ